MHKQESVGDCSTFFSVEAQEYYGELRVPFYSGHSHLLDLPEMFYRVNQISMAGPLAALLMSSAISPPDK